MFPDLSVSRKKTLPFQNRCLAMFLVGPYDVVSGGLLLGSGYCRRNRWRLPECILPLGECVAGPALIFGGTGRWRAPWASALLLRVVPGREKMVEGNKRREEIRRQSMLRFFIRDSDR